MAVVDEVVIAFPLDELIAVLTDAVEVEEAVVLGTVLDDEPALGVELIVGDGEGSALHKLSAEVDALVLGDLVAVVDEVPVALVLYKLVAVQTDAVAVEEAVGLGTVLDDELAFRVELIVADGEGGSLHELGAQIDALVLGDLVAVVDEVPAALVFHQLIAVLADAVDVEEAVGLRTVLDDHAALFVELVVGHGEGSALHELSAEVDALVLGDLVAVVDEVPVALVLHQLIAVQAQAVAVEEAVGLGAVLDDHAAQLVKLIVAHGEGSPLHKLGAQIDTLVLGILVAVVDKVPVALVLYELIAAQPDTVAVEVAVVLGTVLEDHAAQLVEDVDAVGHQAVAAGAVIGAGNAEAAAVEVVIIVAFLDHAGGLGNAVLQVGVLAVAVEDAAGVGDVLADQDALVGELIELAGIVGGLDQADALVAVALTVKAVGVALDLRPGHVGVGVAGGAAVVVGAVVVPGAVLVGNPGAMQQLAVLEVEGHARQSDGAVQTRIVAGVEVIPAVLCVLPALHQVAADGVVGVAVQLEDAGAQGIDVSADGADELAFHQLILMARLGKLGAPVHHGAADAAVGTAAEAGLQAGGRLVGYGLGRMQMPHAVGLVAGELGGDRDAAAEGAVGAVGVADGAADHVHVHKDLGLAVAAVEAFGCGHVLGGAAVAAHVGALVKAPDAGGDADQDLLAAELGVAGLGDGDGGELGDLVVAVGGLEAGGGDHVIELPAVRGVEPELGGDAGDLRDVGGNEIHVVDGVVLGDVVQVIVAGEGDDGLGGIGVHRDILGHGGEVAGVVVDLKLDGVGAVGEPDVLDAHGAAGGGDAVQLHAVGVDGRGGVVQTLGVGGRVIGNARVEGDDVGVDGLAVQGDVRVVGAVGGVGDDGGVTVVHGGAVVEGEVVKIVGQDLGPGGLDVHPEEGGLAVGGAQGVGEGVVVAAGEVRGQIDPSVLGNIGLGALVQTDPLFLMLGVELEVQLGAAGALGVLVDGELHRQSAGGVARRVAEALGDVAPHAQRSGLLAVGHVAEDVLILDVVEQGVDPGVELDVAEVEADAQGAVAVVDLAAVLSGGEEGVGLLAEGDLAAGDQGLELIGLGNAVLGQPNLDVLAAAVPVADVLILEVPEDLGALAEADGVDQLLTGGQVSEGEDGALDALVGGGGEGQAVQSAGGGNGGADAEHVGVKVNVRLADLCHDGQGDGAGLVRGGVGQGGGGGGEGQGRGVCNVDGLAADHRAAGDDLHVHVAQGAVGSEDAVGNGAEAVVRQGPGRVGRHIHGVAVGVDGVGAEAVAGAGGKVIVAADNVHVVQLARGTHVGGDEDAVDGGTLCAVAGDAAHGVDGLAGALRHEGGGAAAVAVDSPLAAQGKHGLAQLVVVEAHGVVGAAAVVHDDHEGAILLDAEHGTGGSGTGALLGAADELTVLDGKVKVGGDGLPAVFRDAVGVVVELAGDRAGVGILDDGKEGLRVVGALGEVHAVVDQEVDGGVGVIGQRGVHGADDVVAQNVLIIPDGLGDAGDLPVVDVRKVRVDAVIAGDDGNVGVGGIHLDDVHHLAAIAGGVVDDHLGFSGRAGNQRVLFPGDHVVIVVGAEADRFRRVVRHGESSHGHRAQKHDGAQKQRYQFGCASTFHVYTPY